MFHTATALSLGPRQTQVTILVDVQSGRRFFINKK